MQCKLSSSRIRSFEEPALTIAIASYYFHPLYGGMETQLLMLSQFLASSSCNVSVFTSLPNGEPSIEDMFGFQVRRYGSPKTFSGLQTAYREMRQEICKSVEKYDVLYMPLGVGDSYPLEEQLDLLSLFVSHGKPVVLRVTSSGRISELAQSTPFALPQLQGASRIIALNEGIEKELYSIGILDDKIFRISNGVDDNIFSPKSVEQIGSFQCKSISRFVCPCRVCEKKSLFTLVTDWLRLRKYAGNITIPELLIVGDDNKGTEDGLVYSNLREMCQRHGPGINLLPSQSYWDMPAIYHASDIYVCYSMQEGMSNAALEAMSCGLPIVVPNTEAFRPLVHNSPNFTFTGDSDRFDAILRALHCRTQWEQIGKFNRKRVVDEFRAKDVFINYLDLFQELKKIGNY